MTLRREEIAGLPKGELYEGLCLLGIAECLWLIGHRLGVFQVLEHVSLEYGLASFVFLGFFMSFAIAAASVLKSVRLRREVAGRREAEVRALSIARRDGLTGLANRRSLVEAITAAAAAGNRGAAFLIDLDRFKPVNDAHGHATGDAVLCELAERLTATVPRGAVAARLGSDEFAVFLPGERACEDLIRFAQQLIQVLSMPIRLGDVRVDVGATIGVALLPQDGACPDDLLRSADIAMHRGKRDGRGSSRFFEQEMDEELRARVDLEVSLRAAIAAGEIRPHYQALVALPGHALIGFEVLARWYHPVRGLISPDMFIPIAEDTGLVADLCYALLRQACQDARAWPAHLTLAINISPVQFKDKFLAPRLLAILREADFPPSRLEVEITESTLTGDFDLTRSTLATLQHVGVSVALDDFGTGYSSLYHLREMRFDKIKIDRSFVQSLGSDDESIKIVGAILGLGQSLGIRTTAEGIETEGNSAKLAAMGCTTGQGFLFGRPIPAAEIDDMLAADLASKAA